MTIKKNIWADIQDGVTQGLAAAVLVNDNKRAVNELVDVVNGLGTASTKNVATNAQAVAGTAGVLPDAAGVHSAFGQFGLGGPPAWVPQNDLNEATPANYFTGAALNGDNSPTTSRQLTINLSRSSTRTVQLSFPTDAGRPFRMFGRVNNDTWQPWRELYHTGNTVGTVSQSGGVPTGAIIQRGSNANGEFVRFADGTQICTSTVTVTSSYSLVRTQTLPISFLAGSNPCASVALSESSTGLSAGQMRDCAAALAAYINQALGTRWLYAVGSGFTVPEGTSVVITLTAIGRWF